VLLRALSSSVTCSLLILSPAKAVNQVDLAARRKESVPFDQVSVMILTGWPVTGTTQRYLHRPPGIADAGEALSAYHDPRTWGRRLRLIVIVPATQAIVVSMLSLEPIPITSKGGS
jgi:hypothetical protein